jgi:L-malate glycosyltransferase
MSKRVRYRALVVQRRLTHYRRDLFETLRQELRQRDCELQLAYGEPTSSELGRDDSGLLTWGEHLKTHYFLAERFCWQPFGAKLAGADIAVLTAENKLIYNLIAQYLYTTPRVALWGHGANLQGDARSFRENFKRIVAKQADWWFGYTAMSVPIIERTGFPRERITVLNNAVNTTEFLNFFQAVTPEVLSKLREDLGLRSTNIAAYVGSLYPGKRIDFMLEAAIRIRRRVPDFEFLIIGSGPQKHLVEAFCIANPWAKYLGTRTGQAKADVLALTQVLLNPGVVGLTILDSFVCGVPMVTTDCPGHGPEIAYLINGENGLMVVNALEKYVLAVSTLLLDKSALSQLQTGCKAAGARYTVENMARNFADGIIRCLESPSYRNRRG